MPCGDEAITAVVARAAHDDRAPPVRTSDPVDGRPRDGTAGPLHQQLRRDAVSPRLRLVIELGRLIRREDRLHPATANANATAFVRSCVNVTSTRATPSASARRFALPESRIDGAPLGCRVTLMSCQS